MTPVQLRPISEPAAAAVLAGRIPPDVTVADGFPTEFSASIAGSVAGGAAEASSVGPFFIHRSEDDVVVGEIGGAYVEPGTVEIGYAVVDACAGRGFATAAVNDLVELLRASAAARQVIAHTPLDRPSSARVVEKAGFTRSGEVVDEDDGVETRVTRWELAV